MEKKEFQEKLPIVLDCLKEAITNEIGNYYDFNFNSYEDLVEKEFRHDILNIFMGYAEAINNVEENFEKLPKCGKTIIDAMEDYGQGYAWTEDDSEDDFQFEETPFENDKQLNEFMNYINEQLSLLQG